MRRLLGILAMSMLSAGPVAAEQLVTALSTDSIAISSNFTGSKVVVFGTIERDAQTISRSSNYEVVIAVTGPPMTVQVREKSRTAGIWLNSDSERLTGVPSFLSVMSTHDLHDILAPNARARLGLGLDMLPINGEATPEPPIRSGFEAAFLRLMQTDGLYSQSSNGVIFLGSELFRSEITLPANVPIGEYLATTYLFRDNALLSKTEQSLEIRKIGFEQVVTDFAHHHGYVYGIATVLIACFTGWVAGIMFRRD